MSEPRQPRQPWNKGVALTSAPALGTMRRWLKACVAEGTVEPKGVERTGKPGRPPMQYGLTEKGLALPRVPAEVQRVQWEQVRRRENAWKRRRLKRAAKDAKAAEAKVTMTRRKLAVAESAAAKADARRLALEMTVTALRALERSGGDFAALLPEETATLIEAGILAENDGRLGFAGDCAEAFDRITGEAADE